MSLLNAEVALTYQLRGAQLQHGVYDFDASEKKKIELEVVKPVAYAKCQQTTLLSMSFVKHAISWRGCPNRFKHPKISTFWKRMTERERLGFHVKLFVNACNGGEYSYNILTE